MKEVRYFYVPDAANQVELPAGGGYPCAESVATEGW